MSRMGKILVGVMTLACSQSFAAVPGYADDKVKEAVPGCADDKVKEAVIDALNSFVKKNSYAIFARVIEDNLIDPENVPSDGTKPHLKRIIKTDADWVTGQVYCEAKLAGLSAAEYDVKYTISPDAEDDDNWFVNARLPDFE